MRSSILSEYFSFNVESLQPDLSGALFVKQKSGSGRHNDRKVKAFIEVYKRSFKLPKKSGKNFQKIVFETSGNFNFGMVGKGYGSAFVVRFYKACVDDV